MRFEGKVALVTGGGRGIGAATAQLLAREGAKVERTVKELGRLDILVACAGITRDNLLYKMTDEDWDAVIDTHLKGTFLCARAAQRYMVDQKYGKMVFLSSISALGNRGQANYSAAKAGLQGMARTLALELGPFNVNVNTVAPGFVETRMTRATAERLGVDFDAFKIGAASQIPLRRVGLPEEVAQHPGLAKRGGQTLARDRIGEAGRIADQEDAILGDRARPVAKGPHGRHRA